MPFPGVSAPSASLVGAPVPLTTMIGRVQEGAEVLGLLGRCRLLTLTGPGGCGKTRLALAVAQRWAAESSPARVLWSDLGVVDTADLAAEQLARAIGASGPTVPELVAALRGRATLLVLDSCEHLVEPIAELTEALLVGCPALTVLATSRAPIRIAGERRWPVPPLGTPEVGQPLVGFDAVELFVERARAVRPDLEVDAEAGRIIAGICRRLDGNPLAIELCAARTEVLSVGHIAGALDDAVRLLSGSNRSAPPRHQTLRATLDWSHRLLPAEQARLFAVLGIFAGPATLAAVEAVAGGDVLERLSGLVASSLVRMAVGGPEPTYELADPVRQYARLRLQESGLGPQHRDRHLTWYAGRASEAFAAAGGPDQTERFSALAADLPNLRAALTWAREPGRDVRGLELAADLAPFATATGHHREGRAWLESALEATERAEEVEPAPGLLARAARLAGTLAFLQCDYPAALAWLEQAEATYARLGDAGGLAQTLQSLGSIAREQGDYPAAEARYTSALGRWRRLGDAGGIGGATDGLAFIALLDGRVDAARGLAQQSLEIAISRQDPGAVASALVVLGGSALVAGDLSTAEVRLQDALDRATRDRLAEPGAYAEEWLGMVALERGQIERAAGLFGSALRRQYELGDLWRTSSVLVDVAACERTRGRATAAARALAASEALLERIGAVLPPVERAGRRLTAAWVEASLAPDAAQSARLSGRAAPLATVVAEICADLAAPPAIDPAAATQPAGTAAQLVVRALGTESVRLDGRPLPPAVFRYAKPRELLFFLAESGPVDKAEIGLALWPDASTAELRNAFHTTLHHLRRAVGPARVVYSDGRYRLAEEGLEYDVGAFRAALRRARAAGNPAAELAELQRALPLYTGGFLPTSAAGWAAGVRDEVDQRYQRALLAVARLLRSEGGHAQAVDAYRKVIGADPLAEVAHRELMLCYEALGEPGRALRQYEALAAVLRDQLGTRPAASTTELRDRLQAASRR